jgi:hypothetical protein
MSKIVPGLFDGIGRAGRVISALGACGFSREDVSLVKSENDRASSPSDGVTATRAPHSFSQLHEFDTNPSQTLLGAQSLPVGGIGPVRVTGPFILTLTRTRDASGTADLSVALTALDIPEDEVGCYAEGVRRGGSLVLVTAPDHMVDRAQDIMSLHNAVDLQQRAQRWRQQGWEHFDPDGLPCASEEITREWSQQANECQSRCGFHPYDRDFRCHYYLTYPYSHEPYERYASAYRYGYEVVCDHDYRGKDWSAIEPRARRQWEQQGGQRWEAIADAVYYGFIKAQEHYRPWTGGVQRTEHDHGNALAESHSH